jgi:hypoxanthine-guanine phosphoribosyltransferase
MKYSLPLKYVGIEVPNLFVIGYGFDYAEIGRNLPDIYILSNE